MSMFWCYYTHGRAAKKSAMKQCSLFSGKYFLLIFSFIFISSTILIKTLESGKSSYRIFWFQVEDMNESCNQKCFPMEFLQELCSLLSISINPQTKSWEDPEGLKLWIPQSLVRVTRKWNIWSLVTALPKKGNYCLKKAMDQLNLPQINANYSGVETLAYSSQLGAMKPHK